MRSALSVRSRITIGSAVVALVVVAISVFAVRVNVEIILHSSNVSLATTDLASFERDLTANPGESVDPPGAGVLVLVRAPDGSIAVDTLRRLAELPRIVGLKDATGDIDRTQRLRHVLGEEFRLFTGDDAAALDCLVRGGDGCISVVANVAPRT